MCDIAFGTRYLWEIVMCDIEHAILQQRAISNSGAVNPLNSNSDQHNFNFFITTQLV